MVPVFIFGSKCHFYFSHSVTLVSWCLGASVKKPASHQFPGNKLAIEEGLPRQGWQPGPGLDFVLGCAQCRRCGWAAAGGSSQLLVAVQAWPGASRACVTALPLCKRPWHRSDPPAGLCPLPACTLPVPRAFVSSHQPQQELGSSWCCWEHKTGSSPLGIWWNFWLLVLSAAPLPSCTWLGSP